MLAGLVRHRELSSGRPLIARSGLPTLRGRATRRDFRPWPTDTDTLPYGKHYVLHPRRLQPRGIPMHSTRLIRAMAFAAILASLAGQPWRSTAAAARAGVPPAATHGRSGAEIPDTPVGSQLRWVLEQLDGGATTLDEAELNTRFAPALLAGFPPAQLLRLLRDSALEHCPIRVTGTAGPVT